ncbi:MAG: SUMF1/EgtB/PvdO family nonheme iron enzyme [Burkholderiales bacterium]|jgi:hypothetical protein|nr:SUMF1/EgtB/PvdO family nonheme iron enzyme [Burkholderiales bacterium]
MRCGSRWILAGVLASAFAANASDPRLLLKPANPVLVDQHQPGDLSAYTTVQVIVEPFSGGAPPHGFEATADAFRRELIHNLSASGKFAVVQGETQGGKVLEARLSIDALNYVHGAARGIVGILAGRAVLGASMTLRDKESGKVIEVFRGSDASSHRDGVFGATTGRQVSAMARVFASRLADRKTAATPAAAPPAPAPVVAASTTRPEPTAAGMEIMFWESVRESTDPADLRAYLVKYPGGTFAPLARNRLTALGQPAYSK